MAFWSDKATECLKRALALADSELPTNRAALQVHALERAEALLALFVALGQPSSVLESAMAEAGVELGDPAQSGFARMAALFTAVRSAQPAHAIEGAALAVAMDESLDADCVPDVSEAELDLAEAADEWIARWEGLLARAERALCVAMSRVDLGLENC